MWGNIFRKLLLWFLMFLVEISSKILIFGEIQKSENQCLIPGSSHDRTKGVLSLVTSWRQVSLDSSNEQLFMDSWFTDKQTEHFNHFQRIWISKWKFHSLAMDQPWSFRQFLVEFDICTLPPPRPPPRSRLTKLNNFNIGRIRFRGYVLNRKILWMLCLFVCVII